MSKDEIIVEKPHEIVDFVERILDYNNQNQEGQKYQFGHITL